MGVSYCAAIFFPLAAAYRFSGYQGADEGVSGARRCLRHEEAVKEGEREKGNKREGESCWKSGGGLYLVKSQGW